MQKIIIGTVTSLAFEAGTMSVPAFANVLIESEDDASERWAKGRVAKALLNAPRVEIEFTLMGDEIVAWKPFSG